MADLTSQLALRGPFLPSTPWDLQTPAMPDLAFMKVLGFRIPVIMRVYQEFYPVSQLRSVQSKLAARMNSRHPLFLKFLCVILLRAKGSADADLPCDPLQERD